jgi:2-methylcitrate dehydratase PrpD
MAAQFSLPWVIACAAVRREVGVAEISEGSFKDARLLDMATKVHTVLVPSLADELAPAKVMIHARSGVFETKTGYALGTIDNPMTFGDIKNKFYKCASLRSDGISEKSLQTLAHLISDLDEISDVNEIVPLLN